MKRNWNLGLWVGFVLALLGVISYPLFFARFAVTRDFPWVNLLILAFALLLIGIGVVRAFSKPDQYRGKISGSILAVLALLVTGLFCYSVFLLARQLPPSHAAPQVGDMAPDFTLPDSKGEPLTLSTVLSSPFTPNGSAATASGSEKPAGAVLIFYRGYW